MANDTFHIRHATEGDAMLIADFGARTFRDAFGPDNRPEDIKQYIASSFSPAKIKAELSSPASTFLLAYEDDRLIGYVKLEDGKTPDSVKGPKPLELVRIYVDPTIIGKGYGSALMKACFEEAKRAGYETIWLGVWEKNERAIKFYKKWGFREVGSQNFVLGSDVQNDLIMVRSINSL